MRKISECTTLYNLMVQDSQHMLNTYLHPNHETVQNYNFYQFYFDIFQQFYSVKNYAHVYFCIIIINYIFFINNKVVHISNLFNQKHESFHSRNVPHLSLKTVNMFLSFIILFRPSKISLHVASDQRLLFYGNKIYASKVMLSGVEKPLDRNNRTPYSG